MRRLRCECGNVVELIGEQEQLISGQMLRCPKCGTEKTVRPISTLTAEKAENQPLAVMPDGKPSWFERIPLVKKLILLVTAAWPLLAVFCVRITAKSRLSPHWSSHSPRPQDWDYLLYEHELSQKLQTAIIPGVIYSTVIYAIVVLVLFVVWFAMKAD